MKSICDRPRHRVKATPVLVDADGATAAQALLTSELLTAAAKPAHT